jgi:hypothetical protein
VLAAPGAIVITKITPGPAGWWVLKMDVVRRGAPIAEGSVTFRTPDGWAARWDNGSIFGNVRLTSDGWAAIEIERVVEQGLDDYGLMVIDLIGAGGSAGPIIGSGAVWLPDGTLLISARERIDGVWKDLARRIPNHGSGVATDTVIDDECVLRLHPLHDVVRGDLSGIDAYDSCRNARPATFRWDGSVAGRDPADPPFLQLGGERYSGADGSRVLPCGDMEGFCDLRWRRPDGTVLDYPSRPALKAWTRDGTALVIADFAKPDVLRGSVFGLLTDGSGGLETQVLAPLPAGQPRGNLYFLQGMADWAAVLEGDEGNVNIVPLDGSPVIGPFDGTLALVNP